MKLLTTFIVLTLSTISFGQKNIIENYKDSSTYRIVLRTEKNSGDRQVVQDNLTFKVKNDTTTIYYMNYIDGTVASLMIPYLVLDRFIEFEESLPGLVCSTDNCQYSIVVADDQEEKRIYIKASSMYIMEELMNEMYDN